jgi:hypothetical protein
MQLYCQVAARCCISATMAAAAHTVAVPPLGSCLFSSTCAWPSSQHLQCCQPLADAHARQGIGTHSTTAKAVAAPAADAAAAQVQHVRHRQQHSCPPLQHHTTVAHLPIINIYSSCSPGQQQQQLPAMFVSFAVQVRIGGLLIAASVWSAADSRAELQQALERARLAPELPHSVAMGQCVIGVRRVAGPGQRAW